jgi:Ankyrin repeats (3 copies)
MAGDVFDGATAQPAWACAPRRLSCSVNAVVVAITGGKGLRTFCASSLTRDRWPPSCCCRGGGSMQQTSTLLHESCNVLPRYTRARRLLPRALVPLRAQQPGTPSDGTPREPPVEPTACCCKYNSLTELSRDTAGAQQQQGVLAVNTDHAPCMQVRCITVDARCSALTGCFSDALCACRVQPSNKCSAAVLPAILPHALQDTAATDVDQKDRKGWTALMRASAAGDRNTAASLLEAGADVNQRDHKGWAALIHAAEAGHVECVKLLLEHGTDVGVQNNYGSTALTCAAWAGHTGCVKSLLEHGADPHMAL